MITIGNYFIDVARQWNWIQNWGRTAEQTAIKDAYLKSINKMKEEEKEEFDLNSQRINILNQELDILRLEFEIEEAAPSSK